MSSDELRTSEAALVVLTAGGFLKRVSLDEFEAQRRGGKGIVGGKPSEEDVICAMAVAEPGARVLFFTDQGKCHSVPADDVPVMGRYARGKKAGNVLELAQDENVSFMLGLKGPVEDHPLVLISSGGVIKRISLLNFRKPKPGGAMAMTLAEGDTIKTGYVSAAPAGVVIVTSQGKVVHFEEADVRVMGKSAQGVRGVRLSSGDSVVTVSPAGEGMSVLVVSEKGFGKLTLHDQFRKTSRGAAGVTGAKLTDKTGKVAFACTVSTGEVILCSKRGKFIRFRTADVRETGRAAVGVRLMKLEEDDTVAAGVVV